MPTLQSTTLLSELLAITEANIQAVKNHLQPLSISQLQHKTVPKKWNAIECLEHLNAYGRFYLPAIEKAVSRGIKRNFPSTDTYDSGWLGEYFANQIRLNEQGVPPSKMPAARSYNPLNHTYNANNVLKEFLAQQIFLKQLLFNAQNVDLGRLRVPIAILPFITLKLGDSLRFVVYHNERHVQQALKASQQH